MRLLSIQASSSKGATCRSSDSMPKGMWALQMAGDNPPGAHQHRVEGRRATCHPLLDSVTAWGRPPWAPTRDQQQGSIASGSSVLCACMRHMADVHCLHKGSTLVGCMAAVSALTSLPPVTKGKAVSE
jgi:hypothetical protein